MSTESGGTAQPLRVGLIGAGPWASQFHAPMLAAGQETTLVAVWSRDAVKASTLAREHGAVSVPTFEALLAACSAVAFAVPPAVQPMLAAQAAAAGKHLLLEKPAALTVADARRLCEAVDDAGVVSQLVLPYRYFPRVVAFADAAAGFPTSGVQAAMISGELAAGGPSRPRGDAARGCFLTSARMCSISWSWSREPSWPCTDVVIHRAGLL